jgi:hypothetical protein
MPVLSRRVRHFQDSSAMGAVGVGVPKQKRSQNWNKSPLEQKSEQVLLF